MLKTEQQLQEQIEILLCQAQTTDQSEGQEPEWDIPEEIKRREDRLATITATKTATGSRPRQREADRAKGRH